MRPGVELVERLKNQEGSVNRAFHGSVVKGNALIVEALCELHAFLCHLVARFQVLALSRLGLVSLLWFQLFSARTLHTIYSSRLPALSFTLSISNVHLLFSSQFAAPLSRLLPRQHLPLPVLARWSLLKAPVRALRILFPLTPSRSPPQFPSVAHGPSLVQP